MKCPWVVNLMLPSPDNMKRLLCLCVALLACTSQADTTTGVLSITGRLMQRPDKGQCMVQLLRPDGDKVATEAILDDFSVQLSYSRADGPYLVNVRCDGYRVFTSEALTLDASRESFATGEIKPSHHLDADGCRELSGDEAYSALKAMIPAFERQSIAPLAKVQVGTPNECADETYVVLRGIDEYSGPGMHWIVSTKKSDGQVNVEQGL